MRHYKENFDINSRFFEKKITTKNGIFMIYKINQEIAAIHVKIKNIALFSMKEIRKTTD